MFLDRDGVINDLVYYQEMGIIDSPFTVEQFKLLPGVAEAINKLREEGFRVVIVSNQPGIAKRHLSQEVFEKIKTRMKEELVNEGAFLDGEYYCLHHPEATVINFKVDCDCRKPKSGLLLQGAKDLDIDLSQSWMIGDGLTDVMAGKNVGCKTILLGRMKCQLCPRMDEENAKPDIIAANLLEAARTILKEENKHGNIY